MQNYYHILGIDRSASQDEIKQAYRRMASRHHPDKGGDTQKFQEIEEAYRILGDPQKRQEYDNPRPNFNESIFSSSDGIPPEFEHFFRNFNFNFNPFGAPQQPKNRTMNFRHDISLEEAFSGKILVVNVPLPNGRERMLEIKIPAGIRDNTTLRLQNMGDDSISNLPKGDIMLTIGVLPHDRFRRQGDNLIYRASINCVQAMLGTSVKIDTLRNTILEVGIPAGVGKDNIVVVGNEGMPSMHNNQVRGDLIIELNITILQGLSETIKDKLKELFKDYV